MLADSSWGPGSMLIYTGSDGSFFFLFLQTWSSLSRKRLHIHSHTTYSNTQIKWHITSLQTKLFAKVKLRLSFRQEGEDQVRDSDRKRKWQSEVRDWHGYIFSLDSLLSLSLVSSILNAFPSRFLPSADKWKQRRDRQWQLRSRALDVEPVPVCTGIFALQQCHSLASDFSSSKWCRGWCLSLQKYFAYE